MEQEFYERINLSTKLENVSKLLCDKMALGKYVSDELILVGYEDFNYILTTNKGKYCVKIFNKERSDEDVKKYIDRIELAQTLNINTPKVYTANGERLQLINISGNTYKLCLFEYIDGKSFYDLGEIPDENETEEIIRQMANLHKAELKSGFIYDKWAIINFVKEYNEKKTSLAADYVAVFDKLVERLKKVELDKLPYGFVHGDIISTNVIKDKAGKLWIIDFAVSNSLPRIIDLAVTACNLCLDPEAKGETIKSTRMIIDEYQKYAKLTDYEKEVFPLLYDLANAMGILQISYLKSLGETTEEDMFWLNESKCGLSFSDDDFWEAIFEEV